MKLLVALIGAVAVVAAAFIGHLPVTNLNAATFSGQVHDSAGQPVPGARVSIVQNQDTPEVVYSDDGGAFHVRIAKETSSLRVSVLAKGFIPLQRDAKPNRSGPEELVLDRMKPLPQPAVQPSPSIGTVSTHGSRSPVIIGNGNDVKAGP